MEFTSGFYYSYSRFPSCSRGCSVNDLFKLNPINTVITTLHFTLPLWIIRGHYHFTSLNFFPCFSLFILLLLSSQHSDTSINQHFSPSVHHSSSYHRTSLHSSFVNSHTTSLIPHPRQPNSLSPSLTVSLSTPRTSIFSSLFFCLPYHDSAFYPLFITIHLITTYYITPDPWSVLLHRP